MTVARVTHVANGRRCAELLPGVLFIEGGSVRSIPALAKFDVTISAIESTDTLDVTDKHRARAAEIYESIHLDDDILGGG